MIVDGVLKINPITENTITITANSETKVYDGTPLTDGGFTFTEGVLVKGDVLTAVVEGSATNVGDPGVNKVTSYVVTRGNKDVTGNYTFTDSVDGKLTINKRTVTLTSETASKEYDGTPLTKPDVAVTGDGFVDGEVSDITATGSVTFVHEGEVPNAITYTTGANYKESNYTISKNEGKLSITKRGGEGKTITVTAANGEKVYDGTPLTDNRFDYTEGVLVDGDVLTAVVEGSQTDVGSSDNVVTSYKVTRGETDVTSSYTFADSEKGALTVTLRGVTFTGESKSLPYTGGMQSITGITQSGLVEGHRYEGLTYKAEGQNVGSYDGAFSGDVVIKDAQGNDVTKNYNVTKTPGKLTITNASFTVTFTGESAEKVYNGKEQSITGITATGLLDGHTYSGLSYEAKGKDVGIYDGAFSGEVKIEDANGADVTQNYAVTQTPGKLTITAVTDEVVVTITGHKDTVTYDGKEHPVTGYDVSISNELYKKADFTFNGTAEVKGTGANTYPMGLKAERFTNKNDNFKNVRFVVTDGELVINKRPVKVTAEKLEYAYNYANPVAHPAEGVARCTVEAANGNRGLLAGDALNADVLYDGQSTQTLIGVYQAVAQIAAAKITNADGDVTANYTIEKVDSTLTIKGNDPLDPGKKTTSVQTNYTVGDVIEYKITVKNVSRDEATNVVVTDNMAEIQPGAGYSVSDDGHTATIASIPAGGTVLVYARHTVTAEDVENAYAGDANGSLTNVANIKFGDWSKDVEGDHDELNDTYEYVVRYYWNNYTSVQPHEEKKLNVRVGTVGTEEPAAIEGYTPVNEDSKKLIISADQSKNVIEFYYYKNVELTANSETYTYDGTEKQVNGFTVKGENKDQDDQTIAADFSAIAVGAKGTNAGEYPANFAENTVGTVDATERYIVTAANNGKLVINPVTGQLITITANSNEKTYDGTPLTDNRFDYTKGVLVEGDVLTAVVEGSATNVGDEGKNVVKSYAVKRGETDVTKNYTFGNSIDGKLTINPRKVTLTSETASKEYDGTPLTRPDVDVTGDGFVAGEVTGITATGSVTLVDDGEVTNAITYTPGANFKEKNYTISKDEGTLSITKRGGEGKTITVTANSGEKVYDGAPLTNNGHTHAGALVEGDTLTAVVEGSQTDVGSSDNVVTSYKVMRGETDVTNNYTFGEPIIGTLTVTPVAIELTAASASKQYDGTPLTKNDYEISNGAFVGEEGLASVTVVGSQTLVGESANKITAHSLKGNTLAQNYTITYQPGKLTVTKNEKAITVTANSHTWEYDGQAHSDGGYTVTYGNESYTVKAGESATLSTGDKVTAVVKGQVKDVDDTKAGNNEIVEWSVEHRDFYNNVTPANGTLTITPRKVTLTSASDSKPYDGTPLTNPEVAVTGDGFVAGEVTGITATGSVTYVSQGEVDNLITFTKNEGFKDSNYEIKEIIGKLSIEALDVTIIITGPSAIREYKPGVTHTIVTGGSELDFVYGSDKVDGKIGVEGMVEGDKILPGTLKHTLEGMYVGEYEGVFTLFDSNGKKADKPTVMHDGVDVTENYKFSYNPGKLTITGKHMDGGKEVENEVPEKNYLLGQKIPFTITVRSVSKDELKDVTVTDPTATILPDRNTANPAYTVSEDEHTATITSLAPEAEVIVYAEHEVTEDDIINRYTNEATINWGNDEVKVSKTPSIEEENPEAELVKEIVLQDGQDENHKFKLGETVYFKITVTNTGNVTLNEYEVKEVLPGAAFIDGTGYTLNNDKTVATIEKMEPVKDGQEAPDSNQIVLYAQYTIKEEDLGNKELKNIVTADNSKPGEVPIPVDEAKSVSGQKIWKDEGNAFNTRPASITLTLMRKLGQNGAAEQYRTMQLGSNGSWRYSFDHLPKHDAQENEYFYWVVEEPVTGYDTAYETKDESHCDIVNNLQTYTLTIHYWQHKLGDTKMEQAFPDYVATLYYKQPYDVESPEREGIILDDMSQARISGTMPAHDLVIDVYYHRIAYRLTIHYIYQDGTMAHEDYTWTYWFNSTYNVPSPIIPGFTPSIDVIAGRMPSHGLELTVVYVGDGEIVIPDEDTSLGFKSYLNAGECFE